ncbi:hypothetical protein [Bradyrhizobium neotropicale]|uniref:hypothetical protein n=1 Tax=Bradyrhizobium neotropicale TaxID=1497615 RepID=UPI001AD72260|nr:hypothetical protein [Bradyrhizobium neotropicale]MBO4221926.1 hypothetical protein [Bradyrhizobium neotropicale]
MTFKVETIHAFVSVGAAWRDLSVQCPRMSDAEAGEHIEATGWKAGVMRTAPRLSQ